MQTPTQFPSSQLLLLPTWLTRRRRQTLRLVFRPHFLLRRLHQQCPPVLTGPSSTQAALLRLLQPATRHGTQRRCQLKYQLLHRQRGLRTCHLTFQPLYLRRTQLHHQLVTRLRCRRFCRPKSHLHRRLVTQRRHRAPIQRFAHLRHHPAHQLFSRHLIRPGCRVWRRLHCQHFHRP